MSDKLNTLKQPWYENGVRFKCTGCGKCCTGEGIVSLTMDEAIKMALFFKMDLEKFFALYIQKQNGKYILKDSPGTKACIFLEGTKCKVYPCRPKQCKTFPYWPSVMRTKDDWENTAKSCEGIDHPEADLVSSNTIEDNLSKMEKLL